MRAAFFLSPHMRKLILLLLCLCYGMTQAQTAQKTTFGGYVIGKASATDQVGKTESSFDLRLARVYANGQIQNIKYRLQMEVNGVSGTSQEKGPRIVDAYAEWVKYSYFQVRFGQFKRAFTFENQMNPWDIGFGGYSQLTDKLAGMPIPSDPYPAPPSLLCP